jgi:hypothetical protein
MGDVRENADDEAAVKGSVPAGGAGADSGSVEAVEIEKGDSAPIQNVSSGNDEPGVGTRGSGDRMERGDGDKR